MARKNWNALQIEYIKSYAKTGVSVMEWCRKKGLNFATAKRYIKKPETAFAQLEESKQSNIRAQVETSPKEAETAKSENVSEVIDIKDDLTEKCESNCESQSETAKPTAKPSRFSSELQSQRRIKHGGYARYFKDKSAFDVVVDFGLKDEIDLMRQRAIASIENLEKFTADLSHCKTAEDKEVTYKLINAAQNALDRAVARIESLSRTNNDIDLVLETIELRKAQTKETLLKADKLAQELGARAASKHKVEYTMDFTGGDDED
jgi:possible terminase small subunit